ncbi:J domain-containing protein [Acanthopleuribacter pedis]|uniref:DnaJ domain-containing protein n=1 Tax=Acanthopleuribacter pedis TaxID=442870 RepID=A0A8J7QGE2_9BACT|nr:J domain-containing protein [Acanthopleuribacter pedis]MBO1319595.1 DnaJ domain-containing protein [Acanthopleuribacter pedis]
MGTLVGHRIDSYMAEDDREEGAVELEGVAAYLSQVARSGGPMSEAEQALIVDICASMAPKVPRQAVATLVGGVQGHTRVSSRLFETARERPELRLSLLMIAWRVAAREHRLTEARLQCIQAFADRMGATPEEFQLCRQPYYRQIGETPYKILGLPSDADAKQVKTAFREKSIAYHPDRNQNASPELQALAAERFHQIKQAYQAIQNQGAMGKLYGKQGEPAGLFHPDGGEVACCFVCGQKARLPQDQSKHARARCPKCQALLLFERTTAQQWLAYPRS